MLCMPLVDRPMMDELHAEGVLHGKIVGGDSYSVTIVRGKDTWHG